MVALAVFYVVRFGTAMPALDDLHMVSVLGPHGSISWKWLWLQHNEHRLPLPKLVYVGLVDGTRDFRAGTWCEVALLASLSLGMILALRSVRGRTVATDVLFPCLWLNWAHDENLLNSFQLCFVLPVVLTGTVLVLIVRGGGLSKPRRAFVLAAALVLLPACGTVGVVQVPILGAWMVFAAICELQSDNPARRRSAWIALAGVALAAIACTLYFNDFRLDSTFEKPSVERAAITAGQFVAQSWGRLSYELWPWSAIFVLGSSIAALVLLLSVVRRRPEERVRAAGLCACFAAAFTVAAGIGWGRAKDGPLAGYLDRYGLLSTSIWCCAYFTWSLYGKTDVGRKLAAIVRGTMAVLAVAIAVGSFAGGARYGEERVARASRLSADIEAGLRVRKLAARNWPYFYYGDERAFYEVLLRMRDAGLGPFWRPRAEVPDRPLETHEMMYTAPTKVRSDRPVHARFVGDTPVLIVQPNTELFFDADASTVRGAFGIYPPAMEAQQSDGLWFRIEWRGDDGKVTQLLERRLDPIHVAADRGIHAFEVALPRSSAGQVVLRTVEDPDRIDPMDWGFWTDVELVRGDG